MIKLKHILNEFEGRPIPMDTPNEFAYLDFKKYVYKNRGMFKKEMLKHVRKSDGQADSSKMFKTLSALWFKWAYKKARAFRHIKDDQKFGRALMVMMVKDNLIFDKKAWKKDNRITHLKETPNLKSLKVAGLYDKDGMVRELDEKIAGYHTLQEDGVGNVNGHSISLEIEETPEGLQRGLMHRKEFPSGKGMLLKFGKDNPTNIWMKNVNFPLDIIYLQDDKVIDMFKNAMPDMGDGLFDSISKVICDMVLELPAGDADKYGIDVGDMFGFNDLRGVTEGRQINEVEPPLSLASLTPYKSDMKPKLSQYVANRRPSTPSSPDVTRLGDFKDNITSTTDFLTQPHDIYNRGGLNLRGQVNMPSADVSWDPNNSLTQWGGPNVGINNSANLSADYKLPWKNSGNLSAKVNYGTGNVPEYKVGYSLNF